MAVTDAGGGNRLKAAMPVAAAGLAVAAAIAGGMLFTQPKTSPLPTEASLAAGEPARPTPGGGGGLAGVQFDQVTPGRPQAGAQDMEIVVKFKDDSKVKDIVDAFWKDQAGGSARAKFETFKASHPELANLKLDRVTYSNELVLVHEGGATPERRLAAMREIAAKLKTSNDISYAEPNMTAHPGGQ